jgi:DNA polymerase III subunit gamma/tau
VKYAPGRIEFEPAAEAAPDLAPRLAQRLMEWTGARWGVTVVAAGGAATLAETAEARRGDLMAKALAHPAVAAVLAAFPGAAIREIREREDGAAEAAPPPPEDDDAWDPLDPFDEE